MVHLIMQIDAHGEPACFTMYGRKDVEDLDEEVVAVRFADGFLGAGPVGFGKTTEPRAETGG